MNFNNQCPHCQSKALGDFSRLTLGRVFSVKCISCNKKVGLPFFAAVIPFIFFALFLLFLGLPELNFSKNTELVIIAILVVLLIALFNIYTPLVSKETDG